MYELLNGKKLLILGATPNEIPLIRRAQELGVYTIVTDYNLNHAVSPAKDVADEYWDLSWSDMDMLEQRCRENGINGITAGFSEFRVDCMIQLSERLGLPHYATPEQLAVTRDKVKFKAECRKYGVPVIREYASVDAVSNYPVIVKPVDRAGSIGVGIAYTRPELEVAYQIAMDKSVVKQVIIEDYITDATEMDVHYVVCDGKIELLCTDDIIPAAVNKEEGKVVQSAWMYPCRQEKQFLSTEDEKLRKMIHGMGIENGTIFFSGFVNSKSEFAFFECGFRLWGEQEFEFNYRKGMMNYLDIYIYHALLGTTAAIERNPYGNANLKGVALNIYASAGELDRLEGIDEIAGMEDCTLAILSGYLGQKCDASAAILSKIALIGFANESPCQLREDVVKAYDTFVAKGINGEDMVFDRIDTDQILTWWREI